MKGLLLGLGWLLATMAVAEPFVDIHLHYNWDQQEVISPQEAVKVLKDHGVSLAVVTSTPSQNAALLRRAGGDWVLPFFSPYITGLSRDNWFRDERVVPQARAALESGEFFGLGEMHLYGGGFGPRRDNKVVQGLLELAVEFDVPMMIHTEASDYRFFLPLCQQHHKVRFLWAHAGSILPPAQVASLLQACPNVWVDLSARDPWHYGNLVNDDGSIPVDWLNLFRQFPDRFMVGTDPVWHAHQVNRWYEADEGWFHYGKFHDFHQRWLQGLPTDLRQRLAYQNALRFLRRELD